MRAGFTYTKALAAMLVLVYLTGACRFIIPYISYTVNYQYISQVLCENRSRPEMHCNGRCHLQKEMKKSAEQESREGKSSLPVSISFSEELPLFTTVQLPAPVALMHVSTRGYQASCYISASLDHTTPPPRQA